MIENFSRGTPTEGLSGTTVENSRNRSELLGAVPAQVSALGEVLAEQAVGVLIGPALPRAMRVTEVDRQAYAEPGSGRPTWDTYEGYSALYRSATQLIAEKECRDRPIPPVVV